MEWQEIFGNWVLIPPRPIGIIHFLGGAFVAAAPHLTYRRLLEFLYRQGFVVLATPFVNTFDHEEIAETVLWSFNRAMQLLRGRHQLSPNLPIYGLGHSMGCKLHLLIGSLFEEVERAGNILMSFNNFAAKEAIPFFDQMVALPMLNQFTQAIPQTEFTPSPQQTNTIIARQYVVQRNLLIKFANDNLDQSLPLASLLEDVAPGMISTQRLRGNHLTPLSQDIPLQTNGALKSIETMGNLLRQELFKEINQVEQVILRWLRANTTYTTRSDW